MYQLLLVLCFEILNYFSITRLQTWRCILLKENNLYVSYMSINEVVWTMALSKNKITFILSFLIWKLSVSRTFSIIATCIQDLESSKKETSSSLSGVLANRKHFGLLLCHITIGLPLFHLSALTKNATAILWFDFFPSLAFFWTKPFLGNTLKKQPLSSMFHVSPWSYPLQSSFIRSIQDSDVVLETPRDSPEIFFSFMPCHNRANLPTLWNHLMLVEL